MGEFKSDRLTDSSRIDTIDNALAALEADLAEAFNVTVDTPWAGPLVPVVTPDQDVTSNILLTPPSINGEWKGTAISQQNVIDVVAVGDIIYMDHNLGTPGWKKAVATAIANNPQMLIGVALEVGSGPTKKVLLSGLIKTAALAVGTVSGQPIYLSKDVPGGWTNARPTDDGNVVKQIGNILIPGTLVFRPDGIWCEVDV